MQELQNPEHRKALEIVHAYLGHSSDLKELQQQPAEFALLFGHWTKEDRIPWAAYLWRKRMIKRITLLSAHGGERCKYPEGSGQRQYNLLCEAGVPKEAIFFQETAMHTRDEAQQAIPAMKKRGFKEDELRQSWVLISDQAQQLRACFTFMRWNHSVMYVVNAPVTLPLTAENGKEAMVEWGKILKYSANGDMRLPPLPSKEVLDAFETLKTLT